MPPARPILLTGFEPFAGERLNPSWEAARALDGRRIGGRTVVARCLPVVFGAARQTLLAALAELRPELVLCLGLANGSPHLALERVALNLDDARIADNQGQQPVDLPVVEGAPAAYFTGLPVKAMLAALRAAGFPAALSLSAGSFVCNHVFFALCQHLAGQESGTRGGFMHVPLLPSQAASGQPSMALATLVAAVEVALAAALANEKDLGTAGGSLAGEITG